LTKPIPIKWHIGSKWQRKVDDEPFSSLQSFRMNPVFLLNAQFIGHFEAVRDGGWSSP
jgi:hypothetical protein